MAAVNPFNEFVKTELPLRPILSNDGNQESVLVRRGTGPRVYVAVDINEGEVLGKSGGIVQSVPVNLAPSLSNIQILANSVKTIATYNYTDFVSKKVIIDCTDGTNFESFELLLGKVHSSQFDYSIYGQIGSIPNYTVDVVNSATTFSFNVTNNNGVALTMNYKEIV